MTQEIKQYLANMSLGQLTKEWEMVQEEKRKENLFIGTDEEQFHKWVEYLQNIEDSTNEGEFACEIKSDAYRVYVKIARKGRQLSIKSLRSAVKRGLSSDRACLRAYGWKKATDVPWSKYGL